MGDRPYSELCETCSQYLRQHRATLAEAILAGQRGPDIAERYAKIFDGMLGSLFCGALCELRNSGAKPGPVALVAVGGYGRRMVAPHSDIDMVFLARDPEDECIAKLAERVLYPLWNEGVDVGHAVRGVEETLELSKTDIRTSTTLLDMRHVAGDKEIVRELEERGCRKLFDEQLLDFVSTLEEDTRTRHDRFGGSLYVREPDLKLGRGGLRDIDVVRWCVRARTGASDDRGVSESGLLSDREHEDLGAAEDYLWTARNRLHLSARRRHDRLTYEDQEQIAAAFGYRDGTTLATEQLLQEHYQHARRTARLVDRIGDRVRRSLRPPPTTIRDLGDGVMVHDRRVTLKPLELRRSPGVAFRLYHHVVREGLPPDPEARDMIAALTADLDWCRRLRRDREAATLFMKLLMRADESPVRRGSLLGEFFELGLLLAMVPEMEVITGRVRHDAYHAFTVDAQSVMAIDHLRALVRGDYASEYLQVSRCAAELPRSRPLYLALLLCGLGTGHPDDPAKHAAALAGPIGERLGLDADGRKRAQWLIANQSVMYRTAMRRDISEPEVIAEVAAEVATSRRLDELYLLTFSYLATASPGAMTTWNARMLADLYMSVREHIAAGGAVVRVEHLRHAALEAAADPNERVQIEAFLASMPERYLFANDCAAVRFHCNTAREAAPEEPVFGATEYGEGDGSLEILVACTDRPGLLADITAALAVHRFSVDGAQLYTRKQPGAPVQAFDLFHVSHPNLGSEELVQFELSRLRGTIEDLCAGRTSGDRLLSRRSRPPLWARTGPRIKTEIHVDNSASPDYTVVDVYTRDRPELLHVIARVLHAEGLSIGLAKVNTEGSRVADVFYVQTAEGGKLEGEGRMSALSAQLRDTIRQLD